VSFAITAVRVGAKVTGVDLTPKLLERAKENAAVTKLDIHWLEGDAEALPVGDVKFDVVVSQFGHMFAPRPEMAIRGMFRVLRSGGTIAFSTGPPELYTGRFIALAGKFGPPLPAGVAPPLQ
jgi:ubiquinone/menaquinone biosynthesis C-methylase UbiE